ncbi:MAG: SUMF1/EgtB/PvdO family nonheme iron enzyme [Candidatus Omnitrophota bacterium]
MKKNIVSLLAIFFGMMLTDVTSFALSQNTVEVFDDERSQEPLSGSTDFDDIGNRLIDIRWNYDGDLPVYAWQIYVRRGDGGYFFLGSTTDGTYRRFVWKNPDVNAQYQFRVWGLYKNDKNQNRSTVLNQPAPIGFNLTGGASIALKKIANPDDIPAHKAIVTDDLYHGTDLSGGFDADSSLERALAIKFNPGTEEYANVHIYISKNGAQYDFLGQTGAPDIYYFRFDGNRTFLLSDNYSQGPQPFEKYWFRVLAIKTEGGVSQMEAGPVAFAVEGIPTPTPTNTNTPTATPSPTSTPTMTNTPTASSTPTKTPIPVKTPTPSLTPTIRPIFTQTSTPRLTPKMTPTLTPTITPALASTATPTMAPSFTPTKTSIPFTSTPTSRVSDNQTITIPLPLPDGVKQLEMSLIPAGTFIMGSPSDETARDADEGPQHQVTISKSFYMGKYEVTQAQWQVVMGNNPSNFKGLNLPVEKVSWFDCQTFLVKLNQLGLGTFRLPTEAEWEYACRAVTVTAFYWGDDPSNTQISDYAWQASNSKTKTHEVGLKTPNVWGLYDMNGNVWEWCQDLYGRYRDESQIDPTGPTGGSFNVLRGGSWNDYAWTCRSAYRNNNIPSNRDNSSFGFRIVKTQ